ncbi:MAG: hypothetical protein MUD03_05685 [Pirellula sp.]|jgi:hypothetical protein|nr:hypothetical protein [Pirellula sp.]
MAKMRYGPWELLDPNDPKVRFLLEANRLDLQQQYRQALQVAKRLEKRLRSAPFGAIHGVGVELFHKRGLIALPLQFCVTVWVDRKRDASELLRTKRSITRGITSDDRVLAIPSTYGGLQVKVLEGTVKLAVDRRETRPSSERDLVDSDSRFDESLTGGIAIAASAGDRWGTLGLVFRDPLQRLIGMTCEHVVSSGAVCLPHGTSHESPQPIGSVIASRRSPRSGVDATSVQLLDYFYEGILGFEEHYPNMKFLVTAPARTSYWSWLLQLPVSVRGASTGRVVQGRVTMPVVHSIELGGDTFRDLMVIHSRSASSSIVSEGDSGAAVIMRYGAEWVWIGLVIGMIDPYTMVACKLPKAWKACALDLSYAPKERRWRLGE